MNSRAQDAQAERVEGGHRDLLRRRRFHHSRQTLAHFRGGFVRESDREDVRGIDVLLDEIGDARRDDARLAGAGAGENEERSFRGRDRGPLRVIEIEKSETRHGKSGYVPPETEAWRAPGGPRPTLAFPKSGASVESERRRPMKTKLFAFALLALGVVCISGCTTAQPTASVPNPDPRQGASARASHLHAGGIEEARPADRGGIARSAGRFHPRDRQPLEGGRGPTCRPGGSAPVKIRTSNLLIRSQMLYPVELRVLTGG